MLWSIAHVLVLSICIASLNAALTPEQQTAFNSLKARLVTLTTTPEAELPDGLTSAKITELYTSLAAGETDDAVDVAVLFADIRTQIGEDAPTPAAAATEVAKTVAENAIAAGAVGAGSSISTESLPATADSTPEEAPTHSFTIAQEEIPTPKKSHGNNPHLYGTYPAYTVNPKNNQVKYNVKDGLARRSTLNALMSNPNINEHRGALLDDISTRLLPLEAADVDMHPLKVHDLIQNKIKSELRHVTHAHKMSGPVDVKGFITGKEKVSYHQIKSEIPGEPNGHAANIFLIAYRGDFPILRRLKHAYPNFNFDARNKTNNVWQQDFGTPTRAEINTGENILSGSYPHLTSFMREALQSPLYAGNSWANNHDGIRKIVGDNNYYLYYSTTPAGWFRSIDLSLLVDGDAITAESLGVTEHVPANLLTAAPTYTLHLKGTKTNAAGETETWTQVFNDGEPLTLEHTSHDGTPVTITQGFYGTGDDLARIFGITETYHQEYDGTPFEISVPEFSSLWWYIDPGKADRAYRLNYHEKIKQAKKDRHTAGVRKKGTKETETGISRRVNRTGHLLRQTNDDLGWKNKVVGWFKPVSGALKNKYAVTPENLKVMVPEGVDHEQCKLLMSYTITTTPSAPEDSADPAPEPVTHTIAFYVNNDHHLPELPAGAKINREAHYGMGPDFDGMMLRQDIGGFENWIPGFATYIYGNDILKGYEMFEAWVSSEQVTPEINNGKEYEEKEDGAGKKVASGFASIGSGIKGLLGF